MKPILLIATGNPGKINMYRELLSELDIELRFLSDFPPMENPEENEPTVRGNALLKAKYYASMTGLPSLADDAGMEIEELGDEPGVKARRWNGALPDNVSDEDWVAFFQAKIDAVEDEGYLHGSFPFARCLYYPNGMHFFQEDALPFYVARDRKKANRPGWPMSDFRVLLDGRREADVPLTDPVWKQDLKAKWLVRMLQEHLLP